MPISEGRGASGIHHYAIITCLPIPSFASPYLVPGFLCGSVVYAKSSFTPHLPNGVIAMQLEVIHAWLWEKSVSLTKKCVLVTQAKQSVPNLRLWPGIPYHHTMNIYLHPNNCQVATTRKASCDWRWHTGLYIPRDSQLMGARAPFKPCLHISFLWNL